MLRGGAVRSEGAALPVLISEPRPGPAIKIQVRNTEMFLIGIFLIFASCQLHARIRLVLRMIELSPWLLVSVLSSAGISDQLNRSAPINPTRIVLS